MIPTCYLRQVPIYRVLKYYEDGSQLAETVPTGHRLQQWWSQVHEDGTPLAPIPSKDFPNLPGQWRDVEIAQEI